MGPCFSASGGLTSQHPPATERRLAQRGNGFDALGVYAAPMPAPDADLPLTLMAVHAHPDDEASSTGGILAKYAAEGVRTVVATCTNGELGDGAGGVKPGQPGHDERRVVAHRRQELENSCRALGVSHLELLGYHDSGMMGWTQNKAPEAFWNTPVADAARRLADLFERYRPQVVVTYDANGFYGHPDHIQAHRVTVAALALAPIPEKLYFPVIPQSEMERFRETIAKRRRRDRRRRRRRLRLRDP